MAKKTATSKGSLGPDDLVEVESAVLGVRGLATVRELTGEGIVVEMVDGLSHHRIRVQAEDIRAEYHRSSPTGKATEDESAGA